MLYIAKNLMGQQMACSLNEFDLRNTMNLHYPETAYTIEQVALVNNKFSPVRHKNWKHTTKQRHQYGNHSAEKYNTDFMSVNDIEVDVLLSTDFFGEEV